MKKKVRRQKVKHTGCEISYENEKDIQQKLAKVAQILGILNSTFKPTVVQTFSRIKLYNALSAFFYMEAKVGSLEKSIRTIYVIRDEFFRRTASTPQAELKKKIWKRLK